jgi:hypothetical protein
MSQLTISPNVKDHYNKYGKRETYLYNNRLTYNSGLQLSGMQSEDQYSTNHAWITAQK